MFKEMKKIMKILKTLNKGLEKKNLTNQEIKDATESLEELTIFKNKINELSNKITSDQRLKKEDISDLLIHLHLNFVRYRSILQEICDLLKKMAGNYGD